MLPTRFQKHNTFIQKNNHVSRKHDTLKQRSIRSVQFPLNQTGFTLTEILILIVVTGIMSIIFFPNYVQNSVEANRQAAQSEMKILALALERDFTLTDVYTDLLKTGEAKIPPAIAKNYDIRIDPENNGSQFTVIATPIGNQLTDYCGTLRLNNREVYTADQPGCWAP